MFCNAKNNNIKIDQSDMDYISFGKGKKDYKRFIIQANSCLTHNAYNDLDKIECPTLIIGGKKDSIVGVNSAKEIADRISNSELYVYEDYGHAVHEEAKDFNEKVLKYLKR